MMISPVSSTTEMSPVSSVRGSLPAKPARFSIPESPLRHSDSIRSPSTSDSILADTVALSGYAALGVQQQAYSPPPGFGLGQGQGNQPSDPRLVGAEDDRASGSAQGEEEAIATTESEEAEEEKKPGQPTNGQGESLSEEEEQQLNKLQSRDLEVRQHEQAHKATGGSLAGGISYSYQRGPDGQNYAVGGEVSIDVSRESEPSATISKMQRVRAAALAPANPSGQDRQVAAQATAQESEARKELSQERLEETEGKDNDSENGKNAEQSGSAGGVNLSSRISSSGGPDRLATANELSAATSPVARLAATYSGLESAAGARRPDRSLVDVFA